jgi:DNA invertase Pin-like site-specific DNA recombinase
MTRTIPGALDPAAMCRLHFNILTRDEQAAAIRRLAASGQSEHTIARATGLSVEMINRILAEVAA